jgi:hypothetical protein
LAAYRGSIKTRRKNLIPAKFCPRFKNGWWKMQYFPIHWHRWQDEKHTLLRSILIMKKTHAKNWYIC